jgi:hypothetical protein
MFLRSLALGTCGAALLGSAAFAGDKPVRTWFAGVLPGEKAPKAAKPYPLSEHKYIKQYPGPTIACGSCFGYFPTQWRSWSEACNEPQVVDAGPHRIEAPVESSKPMPTPEKPREQPPVPKPAEKPAEKPPEPKPPELKKPEPKQPDAKPGRNVALPPLIPAPNPVVVMPPVPVGIEVVVPPVPKLIPTIPAEPKTPVPTVIVPLGSR